MAYRSRFEERNGQARIEWAVLPALVQALGTSQALVLFLESIRLVVLLVQDGPMSWFHLPSYSSSIVPSSNQNAHSSHQEEEVSHLQECPLTLLVVPLVPPDYTIAAAALAGTVVADSSHCMQHILLQALLPL